MGGQRPGHVHARGGCLYGQVFDRKCRTRLRTTGRAGLTVLDARMHRASAPQPQQAPERRPGPPAGCPPCRAGRSGAPGFHISCPGGAYLGPWPPPRSTFGLRIRRAGGGCCAWATIASSLACARATTTRSRSSTTATTAGLLAFCGQMLGSRQEAEDALQHSFASAYRALRGGSRRHRPAPLAVHDRPQPLPVGAARAPRARSPSTRSRTASGPVEGMVAHVQRRADLRELVAELQRLPDDQRAALVLFELGDESHEQIAAVLGVRREKVKALVFQAREALLRARTARETPCVEIREQLATAHRPGAAAQHRAQARRPLPRLRGVRARRAPAACGARGDPAAGAHRRPEGVGPGLRRRRRRRRRPGRRRRGRWRDRRRGRRAGGRGRGRWRGRRHGRRGGRRGDRHRRSGDGGHRPGHRRGWRAWPACPPRASSRRSWPSWRWAAAARRRRSITASACSSPPRPASPPHRPRPSSVPSYPPPASRPAAAAAPAAPAPAAPTAAAVPQPDPSPTPSAPHTVAAAAPAATPTPTTTTTAPSDPPPAAAPAPTDAGGERCAGGRTDERFRYHARERARRPGGHYGHRSHHAARDDGRAVGRRPDDLDAHRRRGHLRQRCARAGTPTAAPAAAVSAPSD